VLLIISLAFCSATAYAKGGHSSGSHRITHSSTPRLTTSAPGTGSNTSFEHVSGYTKKDGTHVDSYRNRRPISTSRTTGARRGT
jgi:hypothetical protein